MNHNKKNDTTVGAGMWHRFVNGLATRFSSLLTRVIQIRTVPETWLPLRIRRRIQKHKKTDVGVYADKRTHVSWNQRILAGNYLRSYKSMDVSIQFIEAQPPAGYARMLQVLRKHASKS